MRQLGSIGISARIGIAFALALPITFWALGSNTFEALENYRRADVITRQNTAANALIAGVYEILIERQYVNNALQANGPATSQDFADIERHRSAARSKIRTSPTRQRWSANSRLRSRRRRSIGAGRMKRSV
jgi:hypothetical protein